MRVLVTGATGLLGNNVARLLTSHGDDVRVLVRRDSDPRPLQDLSADVAQGDVRSYECVLRAVSGMDVVVHCAGLVHIGWTLGDLQYAINVDGTRNLARAARSVRARLVHISTADTIGHSGDGKPSDEAAPWEGGVLCPYVITKRQAERLVLEETERGLDAVVVNPTYMLGPWDWKPSSGRALLQLARVRWLPRFFLRTPSGGNNFCDVRDVASGIRAAITRGTCGRRYILGGANLTYFQAMKLFTRVIGTRPPYLRVNFIDRFCVGLVGDAVTKLTGRESDFNSAAVRMSSQPHYYVSERAQTELGYSPRPVEEAARAAWDWFCQHGYTGRRARAGTPVNTPRAARVAT